MHDVEGRLRGILDGNPEDAAWLYDSVAPELLRRLRNRYPDLVDEIEDLVHDTFILFLRNDHRLLQAFLDREAHPSRSSLEKRLWDLACGLASNRRRSSRHQRVVPLLDYDRQSSRPGAERTTIDRDHLAQLDACLRRGNHRVYLYFQLRYRDGLAPEEIARVTGWSRKATYKLKQALNRQVAACIEDLGLELDV